MNEEADNEPSAPSVYNQTTYNVIVLSAQINDVPFKDFGYSTFVLHHEFGVVNVWSNSFDTIKI